MPSLAAFAERIEAVSYGYLHIVPDFWNIMSFVVALKPEYQNKLDLVLDVNGLVLPPRRLVSIHISVPNATWYAPNHCDASFDSCRCWCAFTAQTETAVDPNYDQLPYTLVRGYIENKVCFTIVQQFAAAFSLYTFALLSKRQNTATATGSWCEMRGFRTER